MEALEAGDPGRGTPAHRRLPPLPSSPPAMQVTCSGGVVQLADTPLDWDDPFEFFLCEFSDLSGRFHTAINGAACPREAQ